MNNQEVIEKTVEFAKRSLSEEGSHDWFHTERVWKVAKYLAKKENADMFIVELAALLHDVADWKLNDGDDKIGLEKVRNWLKENKVDCDISEKVLNIIDNMSFSKGITGSDVTFLEAFVVQDADRLDALGAIGIARAFAFGGNKSRPLYDPNVKPITFVSVEEYRKSKTTTINHFYEKILLLKDNLKTKTAKGIGQKRHEFVENYLKEFFQEWDFEFED